jgi:hypothetical protein
MGTPNKSFIYSCSAVPRPVHPEYPVRDRVVIDVSMGIKKGSRGFIQFGGKVI